MPAIPRVRIYHNNLWARYKGAIFSEMYSASVGRGVATSFIQIAETEVERALLGSVDVSYHRYPYRLLFSGSYDDVPVYRLLKALTVDVLRNPSELVVLPGYHRVEYWAMLIVCILLRRRRAVFCDSTANDREKHLWKEKAKAFFFRRCDGFFCYGIRSKNYVVSYGVNEEKTYYRCQAAALPTGYDSSAVLRYYESHRRDTATPTPSRFLYIGRLSVEKGLYDLLEAFRLVRDQIPTATLDLVGSGLLKVELIECAKRLGVDSAVAFLGTKSPEEIGHLLMRSTALILPSHREPWGLVVNEALSYGCPVVVSNICGCIPELVIDGITGYSFQVANVTALCAAIIATADMSVERRAVAGQCLQVIAQYTPEKAASEILRGCVRILESA